MTEAPDFSTQLNKNADHFTVVSLSELSFVSGIYPGDTPKSWLSWALRKVVVK